MYYPTNFVPVGLKYWRRIYDSLVSGGWKSIRESWDETLESQLFSNNEESLKCPPCSGLHSQQDTDHCLHCEELLQLSFFSILLSQAAKDEECLNMLNNLLEEHVPAQKLMDRIYASSIYISHLAGKVFVSLISLNPNEYLSQVNFYSMVQLLIDHPQSHTDACRGFLTLKNLLRTKLPRRVNIMYVAALCFRWTTIFSSFQDHIEDSGCNLAFLTFWWKLFKNIEKNDFKYRKATMAAYFLLYSHELIERFQSSWTDDEHLYKISLKLFCIVLNYETDLSIRKDIPGIYKSICVVLLQDQTFSQAAFSASVLKSNRPVRIGGSKIQIHPKPNADCDEDWTEFEETGIVCSSPLNMSLLRKLILLEFNVCAIALRSDYFKQPSSESEDNNDQLVEQIQMKLQQMCLFIHQNLLKGKSPQSRGKQVIDWLPQVFAEQDNCWIQVLLAVTDLYVISKMWNKENSSAEGISNLIDPHLVFQQFLESLAYDASVLLDLLTSPETCFLLYFLKYLKLLSKEWHLFKALHEGTYRDSRNTTASVSSNAGASASTINTRLPKTSKMDQIARKNKIIVDSAVKSEDYHSLSSSSTFENIECQSNIQSDIAEENEAMDTIDCRVDNSENVPISLPYNNDDCTIKNSEDISFGIGTKQPAATETLNSVSNVTAIVKRPVCMFTKLANLECYSTDSQDDKDVSHLSEIEKMEVDNKGKRVGDEMCQNPHVKGIGLASIQAYSNESSSSESEEDEDATMAMIEKHTSSSSVLKDASDTQEQFHNFKYGESEKRQILDTFRTSKGHQELFGNTFISSKSHIPYVASSTSTLDRAMFCLHRLLHLIKRLSKSSVFPYNPKPLINALEVCVALYKT